MKIKRIVELARLLILLPRIAAGSAFARASAAARRG
jgi:hypothetical protein